MIIAVDFDGTLVHGDKAIEGAKEAINILREHGHKIVIYSCNRPEWIVKVLGDCDIRYNTVWVGNGKPAADLYVDDRGYCFRGDWPKAAVDILSILRSK